MLIRQLVATAALAATLMEGALDQGLPQLDAQGHLFLVNRQQEISQAYVPELIATDVPGTLRYMRPDVAKALEEMFAAAKKEARVTLISVSGYRSYSKQSAIYSRKIKNTGSVAKAQEYVAPPGASEHQTGLSMDVGARNAASGLNAPFGKSKAGKWLAANAHRFGFIIRYQEGWEDITGYNYEPWHVRYVGMECATAMFEQKIPLETYLETLQTQAISKLLKAE